MATPDLLRLAERVKQRRLELNLSVKRAAALAGMSKDTWMRVEKGDPVHHVTYDKTEDALGWSTGSCRKIIDGGEPVLLDATTEQSVEFTAVPPDALEAEVRQAVQGAMVAGTNLTADKIRDVNEIAIKLLRDRGVLPPAR